ncbi:MAG: hypothetical protein Q9M50_02505 [Methylococcales bacterium]|nr:hypothetical protein [Methylococcales bacterium]
METYFEEGIIEGRKEGEIKGRKEGEIKGRKEGKIENAKALKELGVSIETIVTAIGLTTEEIERL